MDHDRGLVVGSFESSILCRNISEVVSFRFQGIRFRIPRELDNGQVAGKSMASNNS